VCDEAQKIKTPGALVTRAAKALRGEFKVACTGTPVENTLADLWCLFDFFQPGLLGSLNEFTNTFRRSIETRADGHDDLIERLRAAVDPWILRRMKFQVTKLPKRIDHHHENADFEWRLPMSDLQQRLYKAAVEQYRRLADSEMQGTAILQVLHTLRMICSNPVACAHEDAEFLPIEQHLRDSPKLAWLLDRLTEIRARGEKAIVFTEYRDLQRLIQRAILHRFDFRPEIVNGGTSVDPRNEASRQALIDRFQAAKGFGVIVLSTTAVGFGVNVQGANHVIHFTRPWNPAKEDQATDRAYRIGQKRDVFVYCPTIMGSNFESFDQRVDALLAEKRALSHDILAGTQEITLDEFKGL
jgi:SNF2 family DNA or RNA helicase